MNGIDSNFEHASSPRTRQGCRAARMRDVLKELIAQGSLKIYHKESCRSLVCSMRKRQESLNDFVDTSVEVRYSGNLKAAAFIM